VPHDIRDTVVDYVRHWSQRAEIPIHRLIHWLGFAPSKFHDWRKRYGLANEHNGLVPRDWWLEAWEKEAIIAFYAENLPEGYRRLAFMMLDADVVAVSPSSVYRVLRDAGLLNRSKPSASGPECRCRWRTPCVLQRITCGATTK
jgi:putative transposase